MKIFKVFCDIAEIFFVVFFGVLGFSIGYTLGFILLPVIILSTGIFVGFKAVIDPVCSEIKKDLNS